MSQSAEKIFQQASQLCEANPRPFQKFEGLYSFQLLGTAPALWFVRCGSTPAVWRGSGRADCSVTLDERTFIEIVDGTLNPQLAYRDKRLEIEGDPSLALRLHLIFAIIEQAIDPRAELLT